MKNKYFIVGYLIISIVLSLCSNKGFTQNKSSLPNILIFIADDAGMDFRVYGNHVIQTPNIDALANSGLRLNNAFLTSSQCSPTRTSILSGQFAHSIGTEDLHEPLPDTVNLIPHHLKKVGYYTGLLMKSHLGEHGDKQFDKTISL